MKAVFCLAAFAAFVNALPSVDTVVPEVELANVEVTADWRQTVAQEAKDQVTSLLQSGKDEGACADLAASTVKEVEDGVKAQQQILNSLDNGDNCPKEGQAGVDGAQKALDSATGALSDAEKAFADAENAPVSVPTKPFASLKEGECGFLFSDSAYTTAKATFKSAKDELEKAKGTKKAAEDQLKAAKEAQVEAVKECQCAVRSAYNKAWKAANANNDENEKAYTKGKHMECVLKGTPPASCEVGDIPKVTDIQLADGVPAHHCASFGAPKTKNTQEAKLRGEKIQYLDRQRPHCDAGNAMTQFHIRPSTDVRKDMFYKYTCVAVNYGEDTSMFEKKTSCQLARNQYEHYLDRQTVDCGAGNFISDFKLTGCSGDNKRYTLQCLKPESPVTSTVSKKTECETGVNKNMEYLDRLNVQCPAGTALQKFKMTRSGCSNSQVRYEFTCAK